MLRALLLVVNLLIFAGVSHHEGIHSASSSEKFKGIAGHNLGAVEYYITAYAGRQPGVDRNALVITEEEED
jgi:hypothetical protein